MSEATNEAEKILESLSQEERLKLLERLIQGATEIKEENLTVEERLDRLEGVMLEGHGGHGRRHKIIIQRQRHALRSFDFDNEGGCMCCS